MRSRERWIYDRRGFFRLCGLGATSAVFAACSERHSEPVPGDAGYSAGGDAARAGREAQPDASQDAGYYYPRPDAGSNASPYAGSYAGPYGGGSYANPYAAGSGGSPYAGSGGSPSSACVPTSSDVLGPFYLAGAPSRMQIAAPDEPGEPLVISGTVRDADCNPLAQVLLDIWQADRDGNYHNASTEYRLRGQLLTDAEGRYEFSTIRPGNYALTNGPRPAHIHLIAQRPGFAALTTQIYFEGDPYLAPNDACGTGCNSGATDLIIALSGSPLRGTFDVALARSA